MPIVAPPATLARIGPYLLLIALGCDASTSSPSPAVPPVATAETALRDSLDAWQGGRRDPGGLIGSGPAVGVVDTLRPERPLIGFDILGATGSDGPARTFAVRLQLGEPAEELDASYLVLGRDPLWVFRREDYDLILHWEHKMAAPAADPESARTP